jgi:hypothetical protein
MYLHAVTESKRQMPTLFISLYMTVMSLFQAEVADARVKESQELKDRCDTLYRHCTESCVKQRDAETCGEICNDLWWSCMRRD